MAISAASRTPTVASRGSGRISPIRSKPLSADPMYAASERAGAFFGRRKGKRLRAHQDELVQTLLPSLRVTPGVAPSELFQASGGASRETWLEIGFGGGEHLAA